MQGCSPPAAAARAVGRDDAGGMPHEATSSGLEGGGSTGEALSMARCAGDAGVSPRCFSRCGEMCRRPVGGRRGGDAAAGHLRL